MANIQTGLPGIITRGLIAYTQPNFQGIEQFYPIGTHPQGDLLGLVNVNLQINIRSLRMHPNLIVTFIDSNGLFYTISSGNNFREEADVNYMNIIRIVVQENITEGFTNNNTTNIIIWIIIIILVIMILFYLFRRPSYI